MITELIVVSLPGLKTLLKRFYDRRRSQGIRSGNKTDFTKPPITNPSTAGDEKQPYDHQDVESKKSSNSSNSQGPLIARSAGRGLTKDSWHGTVNVDTILNDIDGMRTPASPTGLGLGGNLQDDDHYFSTSGEQRDSSH